MHHSNLSLPNLCCHVAFSLSGSKFCFCNKDTSHWVRAHPNPAWLHLNLITPPKIWVANKMTLAGTQGEDIFLGNTSQLKRTTYYTLTISGITNGLEKAHLQSQFLNMWCSLRIKANRPLQRASPAWGGRWVWASALPTSPQSFPNMPCCPFLSVSLHWSIPLTLKMKKNHHKKISIGNYSQTTFDQPGPFVSLALRVAPSNPDLSSPLDSLLFPNTFTSNTQSGFPGQWHTPKQITWYIQGECPGLSKYNSFTGILQFDLALDQQLKDWENSYWLNLLCIWIS